MWFEWGLKLRVVDKLCAMYVSVCDALRSRRYIEIGK